jgi:hypothetical protein
MSSRSIFLTSLLSLCIAGTAAIGCAAPSADEVDEDAVAESSDELSAAAQQLVGKYYSHQAGPGQYPRLTLNANGTYTGSIDISDVAFCVVYPCVTPQEGKWNASKSGGKLRLRLKANGETTFRWYDAVKSAGELKISRAGKTQTLYALEQNACLDDADCSANQECGPKLCLMWCAVDDPFCCGPSTCQPKTPPPPPPPACCDPYSKPANGIEGVWCCGDGSWQYDIGSGNQTMSCSQNGGAGNVCAPKFCGGFGGLPCTNANEECIDDPNDSCDPKNGGADCGGICVPKSTPCGPTSCGAGEVCCNPLSGICTKPGEVCAF